MDLNKLVKTFIISLGFTANLNIFFTPPVVLGPDNTLKIYSKLENAITKEVKELILSSTKVAIEYKITLFTSNKKLVYTQRKSVLYNSLTREIILFNNDEESLKTENIEEAIDELSKVSSPLKEKGRLVVIKARLIIPDLEDQSLADSLWHGIEPRVTYNFTGD